MDCRIMSRTVRNECQISFLTIDLGGKDRNQKQLTL